MVSTKLLILTALFYLHGGDESPQGNMRKKNQSNLMLDQLRPDQQWLHVQLTHSKIGITNE